MCHIRQVKPSDYNAIYKLEVTSFSNPWSQQELTPYILGNYDIIIKRELKQKAELKHYCNLAILNNNIIGQIFYQQVDLDKYVRITNLSVDENHRRTGIGKALIDSVVGKALKSKLNIVVMIRESNLRAQMLFKTRGFKWLTTIEDSFEDTNESGYFFIYHPEDIDFSIPGRVLRRLLAY